MAWIDTMVMNSAPWFGVLPDNGGLWMAGLLIALVVPATALVLAALRSTARPLHRGLPREAAALV
jgi:hypothetical protein